jgi:small GTP-binding protein
LCYLQAWDIGGQHKIRTLWSHYYQNTNGLMFVIDSVDKERFEEAAEELHATLSHEYMQNVSVLIMANKQDMKGAVSPKEIASALKLDKLTKHSWYVQACSAKSGDGIYEGLDWLTTSMKKLKQSVSS